MGTKFLKHFNTRQTPQSEPIPGSAQVPNSAGGYAFAVDDWTRLERFLILGSEGGSYYATERALTVENAKAVVPLPGGRRRRGRSARSSQVSDSGRAPKNEPAVLALAIAAGMGHTAAASEALPKVCRTGTHLFAFAEAVQGLRGWGRGAAQGRRRLVRGQGARGPGLPGRQVPAARRLVAPRPAAPGAPGHGRPRPAGGLPLGRRRGRGARAARGQAGRGGRVVPRRRRAPAAPARRDGRGPDRRPRGRHPADPRGRPAPRVRPDGAPERPGGLGGAAGGHAADGDGAQPRQDDGRRPADARLEGRRRTVRERLADGEHIRKSRLHPLAILLAAATYTRGRGLKGSLSWEPVATLKDALDDAFYKAFGNVDPGGQADADRPGRLRLDVVRPGRRHAADAPRGRRGAGDGHGADRAGLPGDGLPGEARPAGHLRPVPADRRRREDRAACPSAGPTAPCRCCMRPSGSSRSTPSSS